MDFKLKFSNWSFWESRDLQEDSLNSDPNRAWGLENFGGRSQTPQKDETPTRRSFNALFLLIEFE